MLVVTYHAITTTNSPVTVTKARLASHLDALADAGYRFQPLSTLTEALTAGKTLPRDAVALTFDDGYGSVATVAWPMLASRGVPASVFVIAGRIGQDNRWPGQAPWVDTMPLLDTGALQELADAGADIGGHSWSHPRLPEVPDDRLDGEMGAAADRLEQLVQRRVRHFAYPYGVYGAREVAMASRRFDLAVTAECRRVTTEASRGEVGRLDAHDLHVAAGWRLLRSSALDAYLSARRGLRRLSPLR